MPVDKEASTRSGDMQNASGMSRDPKGPSGPDPCKAMKDNKAYRVVLLFDLYPELRPGTYTLQITLAPRGTSDKASLAPITIKI